MRSDIILGTLTFLLAVLGGVVSAHAPTLRRHKIIYVVGFVVLGAVGIAFVIKQANEAARASGKLGATLDQLGKSNKEIERVTQDTRRLEGLNSQLQARLLTQTQLVATLSKKNLQTATGGDSYCYARFANQSNTSAYLAVIHRGKYPLRAVTLRLADQDRTKQIKSPISLEQLLAGDRNFTIGDLSVSSAVMFGPLPLAPNVPGRIDLLADFGALNGRWEELIRLRQVNGNWVQAIKVFKYVIVGKNKPMQERVLWKQIDPNYPRVTGVVDWNN